VKETANLRVGEVQVRNVLVFDQFQQNQVVEPFAAVNVDVSELREFADFLLSRAEVHELTGPEDESFKADSVPERLAFENGLIRIEKVKIF
jgi:hypothetical protein